MSGTVKLLGALPEDERRNGLEAIADRVLLGPTAAIQVVATCYVDRIIRNVRTGDHQAVLRIASIEVADGEDATAAEDMQLATRADRIGEELLPFGTEDPRET